MKHSIFIIFISLIFISNCANAGRGSKRNLPKPLNEVLTEVSSNLKKQISTNRENSFPDRKNALKLAILPLLNEVGDLNVLGLTIASQLSPQMSEPGKIVLVEKSQLNRLIDEQSFQKTGLVLSDKNMEIGKLSGVDILILGTVQFSDQTFLLQIRAVSLQSGEIIASSESVFDSTDNLYDQSRFAVPKSNR
ncbi:penicillin-binding protein activator LpoB [Leptospira barantonii]|uniref:Penicillin-binding protein activator LpoB n=1 Tax=Leptospira barantonii TaxID=2023184 RepID=A0A5F2BDW0_9LEPT|nr:FlgO family outer membrane protein [Leptospira barantonii]TGM03741.1 penicillin-binding protein activator LpoB [Leptospira barantonii]